MNKKKLEKYSKTVQLYHELGHAETSQCDNLLSLPADVSRAS